MASKKNQAKITFLAETKEFREDVKKAASSITELSSELKLNAAQMKTSGETVELLTERQELLQKELEQAQKKTKSLSAQMDSCTKNYGENSTEAQKLATQINNAKTAEEKIRQEINKVNDSLEEHAAESSRAVTGIEKLEKEISEQESALNGLVREYKDAVIATGEDSAASKKLKGEIAKLSKELGDNKSKLSAAENAADEFVKSLKNVDDAAENVEESVDDQSNALDKLKKSISAQESELDDLKSAYANVIIEQGRHSREAKDLAKHIRSLSGELSENRSKMSSAENAADRLAKTTDDAGDAARDADDGFTVWKGTLSDLASEAIQGALSTIGDLASNLWGLSEETREFRTNMGKVEATFENSGHSAESAGEAYEDFYALLGDEGQTTEAVSHFAKLAKSQDQLDEYLRISTGLYATFGDSLPIENLAEAANETAKTGKVTGGLADALNWSTMSSEEWTEAFNGHPRALKKFQNALKQGLTVEDAFNEALTRCTTESEREQVIRQALNGLYGDAAEKYAENNSQIMDANRAQAEYNSALAGLGDTMEPLTTAWTSGMATIMESFGDMLDEVDMDAIVDTLEDGFDWVINTAFPAVKTGIQWFLDNKGAVITGVSAIGAAFAGIKVVSFVKMFGNFAGLFGGGGGGSGAGGGGGGGIFGTFSKLANTNITTVLKGITNLSIILVALGGLATLFAWAAPFVTSLCDGGQFVKLIAALAMVGLVGTAMAKLAGSVGNIPVSTVSKGLANIAIVMTGLGALTAVVAWVAPYITELTDSGTFLELLTAIGIVGVVGSALAGLAGLIGAIPIPVVLTGLGNIALALGGFTAIVSAFGALALIPGFSEFISGGGDILTQICGILGEMAGALIGGIGETASQSLVVIGENLSVFAEVLEPMFESFAGVDAAGLKDFSFALLALFGVLAGEALLSIFTGGIDYAGLGVDLSTMATNMQDFFGAIATFSDEGFAKATALFDCLAGIASLPKEGGVVGWFQGEVDYAKMATGLNQLAGTRFFFTSIQAIPEAAFAKATQLFDCLAGIKALPQDGGVVGWFMGEVDFSKIASGVQSLASAGMIAALMAISIIPTTAYGGLTAMFDALAGIKALPAEGGIFGWFTGSSTQGLTSVAAELPGVATNIASFFSALGGRTDFTPIKTLFDTLSNIEINTNVADKGFWSGVSQLGGMGTELSAFASNGATFFSTINTLNLANLTGFWDALGGAAGLPSALSSLDAEVGTALSNMLSTTQTKMQEIRDEINIDGTDKDIATTLASANNSTSTNLGSMLRTVSDKFQSILGAIEDKMASAKDAVSDAISEIKKKFDFSWSLPKLKLPHVKISGKFSIDPPTVPKFSVSWYKDGGILTQPTIFGAMGNTLLGGGEAGAEAVAPIDVLLDYVRTAVKDVFSALNFGVDHATYADRLENSNNFSAFERAIDAIESFANRPIELYIDGKRFATATAGANDSVTGNRLNFKTRGLAIE